jgi:hypothetical protein
VTREAAQRAEELQYAANFFSRHFGHVPPFEPLPPNSRPDVCVHFEGKRVGIEMTGAPDSKQAVYDTFAAGLLEGAKERHESLGGMPGGVMVSLRPRFTTAGKFAKALGEKLGEAMTELWLNREVTTVIDSDRLPGDLAGIITRITAFPVEGAKATHWQAPMASWVQGISAETLQPVICRKAKKMEAYRAMGCDELWLLIYAKPKSSEMFDLVHGFHPAQLHSPFARTFFADPWRTLELATG